MIIAGTLNKLGSQNKFSKLVIIDPPYTKVSPTLTVCGIRFLRCWALQGYALSSLQGSSGVPTRFLWAVHAPGEMWLPEIVDSLGPCGALQDCLMGVETQPAR